MTDYGLLTTVLGTHDRRDLNCIAPARLSVVGNAIGFTLCGANRSIIHPVECEGNFSYFVERIAYFFLNRAMC